MNYSIRETALPAGLARQGVRVWVGDRTPSDEFLEADRLRLVSAFLYHDTFGEVVIVFAAPAGRSITPVVAKQCRQCALRWLREWSEATPAEAVIAVAARRASPPAHAATRAAW